MKADLCSRHHTKNSVQALWRDVPLLISQMPMSLQQSLQLIRKSTSLVRQNTEMQSGMQLAALAISGVLPWCESEFRV